MQRAGIRRLAPRAQFLSSSPTTPDNFVVPDRLESHWEADLVCQARAVQTPSADAPGCRGIPFTPSQLRRIRELVFEHQASFVERWHEHFGR
jgi:hypothetical protein